MGFVLRLLAGLVAVVVGLPLLGLAGLLLYLRIDQPETAGTLTLPGLTAPVEVVADEFGLPHIFAATETDAYRALGYLHARDRLTQMEVQRRIGAGRVAELAGGIALPLDRTMRTLGLYAQAEAAYAELPAEVRAAVDAYGDGVNAWLTGRTTPLPLELQLLLHTPEPWRPADTLVYGRLMSLLGGSWRGDVERAALLQRLGPEKLGQLFPDDPPGSPVTLEAAIDWVRFAGAVADLLPDAAASNWWVLSGAHTASGKPLLVTDPHLNLQVPSQWYLARIVTPELTLAGAFAPGAPFLIMGHNGHVARGFTTPYSDTEDLFVETVAPTDSRAYLRDGAPTPFQVREETIRVRLGRAETLRIRSTERGPVISDVDDAARDAAGPGKTVVLASAALSAPDGNIAATWRLNRARSVREAMAALETYAAPHQNIALADTAGDIGFVSAGRIPIREGFDGKLPVAAETGARWTGFIPFAELPQAVNPASGKIVNANNRVAPPDYPHAIGHAYAEPWRAARIAELLAATDKHDAATAASMLADVVSLPARELLPLLLAHAPANDREARVLALLRGWDGAMRADRPEPLIFEWWQRELHRLLVADEMGPLFDGGLDARRLLHLFDAAPAWCDDVTTGDVSETCPELVGRALALTLETLADRHGDDPAAWRWGEAHQVETGHTLLARVPGLALFFSARFATDGGHYTVNRASGWGGRGPEPFAHNHGATFRGIFDMADLDRAGVAALGGPSGDPLSDRFATLTATWRRGGHVALAGTRETLAAAGGTVLRLEP